MDWKKMKEDFEEEIEDAMKYHEMAKTSCKCCKGIIKAMAWDEYSHAKHLMMLMEEHNHSVSEEREILHHTKEILEKE